MAKPHGSLNCAFEIRGGHAFTLGWEELAQAPSPKAWRWIHLDRSRQEARAWLRGRSGVARVAADALLADETRPRFTTLDDGALLILRGINTNADAKPEDMVSVRIWIEKNRIITVQRRALRAIAEVKSSLEAGDGPKTPGDFVIRIAEALTDRVGPLIETLDDRLEELETALTEEGRPDLRAELIALRRSAIPLRRYLSPQREALAHLIAAPMAWLDDLQRAHLREVADRTIRFVEDLDAVHERATLLHGEFANHLSERINVNIYVLSIVAAVILPLSLVTGLLGANVGGIPGESSPWGFALLTLVLAAIAAAEVWILKRLDWI